MKRFNLNKIKIAQLKEIKTVVAGANDIVYTDNPKLCKTETCDTKDCGSANAIICTNTTIQDDPTTTPNDTIRTTLNP